MLSSEKNKIKKKQIVKARNQLQDKSIMRASRIKITYTQNAYLTKEKKNTGILQQAFSSRILPITRRAYINELI